MEKVQELNAKITEMNPGLPSGATVDTIKTTLANDKRVFLTSEVNADSTYLGFELFYAKLGEQLGIWGTIKASEDDEDRNKANDLAISTIENYQSYINSTLLFPCTQKENATAIEECEENFKVGSEKHNLKLATAQYNKDYLTAEIAQAQTLYDANMTEDDADYEENAKLGDYLEFMNGQKDEANSYLMQASQAVTAKENSMTSLWIFVSIMSVIALAGSGIAYKQCKDDAEKEREQAKKA